MNQEWSIRPGISLCVEVNGRVVLSGEDWGYILGAFEGLQHLAVAEIVKIIHSWQPPPGVGIDGLARWPTYISIDDTSLDYFEKMASGQWVRPRRGIDLIVMEDRSFYIGVTLRRSSASLEWPDMARLLAEWCRTRECELEFLAPVHSGVPHVWEAHLAYPHVDQTVAAACRLAEDAIGLVNSFQSGHLDREVLVSVLRSGQASMLIGCEESQSLEAKRPPDLKMEAAKLELAKDVAALANSIDGGVIIIGAGTRKVNGRDMIEKISAISDAALLGQRVMAIIQQHTYPIIVGLRVDAVSVGGERDGNVLMIDVPSQPKRLRPFLAHGVAIGPKRRDIFIAVPERTDANTSFMPISAIHTRLVAGSAWLDGQENGQVGN